MSVCCLIKKKPPTFKNLESEPAMKLKKDKIFLFEEEIWRLLAFSFAHDLPDHTEKWYLWQVRSVTRLQSIHCLIAVAC